MNVLQSVDVSGDPTVMVLVERLIDLKTVAELASLSDETIRKMVNEGTFPQPLRLGRHLRWRASDYNRWIAERFKQQIEPRPRRGRR